jgi:hypothetical protein
MAAAKQRPKIKSITVELEDGRKLVIDGTSLADTKGGTLVWNDFGVKKVMKAAYKEQGEDHKAKKTEEIWDGTSDPAAAELPAVMIKPQCEPDGWP